MSVPAPLLAAVLALVWVGAWRQDDSIELVDGEEFAGSLELEGQGSLCFELDLPADVAALELVLTSPLADLDLFASPGQHADSFDEATWSSISDDGPERIEVHALGDRRLVGGRLFVCVGYAYAEPPIVGGAALERAPFRLLARTRRARVDARLSPGVPLRSGLDADGGGFRTFAIEVPPGAACLRVDLFDVHADLDLFAAAGTPRPSIGPHNASAQNPWGAEHVVVSPGGAPALEPGTWYVHVLNLVDATEDGGFGILARFEPGAALELQGLPDLSPAPEATGFARTLCGVFELFSGAFAGSATCVSESGLLLTNAHVVDTGREEGLVLCATTEPGRPARESFRGRVVALDRELDLALVQITSGFRGEPIPATYRFPCAPLGDPASLQIGAELYLAGYPTTGGRRSRVSLSMSRGIVSGFERGAGGLMIKTDAEIESGSSGGAALDAAGRFVGVPSSKVEVGSGHFGFVQPITALPAAWRERIASEARLQRSARGK